MQFISFMYLSPVYRKKFASGGTGWGISPSRIYPLRCKERVHSFFLPPHLQNLLTAYSLDSSREEKGSLVYLVCACAYITPKRG